MKIVFSPVRMDGELEISVDGDTIFLNGEAFDFSELREGFILPNDAVDGEWFGGDVVRDVDGEIVVTLLLPHSADSPEERRFPEPVAIEKGRVELPSNEVQP